MFVDLTSPPKCSLEKYEFASFSVGPATRAEGSASESLDVGLRFLLHKEDKSRYRVVLDVSYRFGTDPCMLVAFSIDGYFRWGDELTAKDGLLARVNGGTILYGIARATVATMTTQCACGQVLLPTVMMVDIVKRELEAAAQQESTEQPVTPAEPPKA